MKKVLALILAGTMMLSVAACGGGGSSEPVTGTYQNVTFSPDTTYKLNENSTYDKTAPNGKGTYEEKSGGFVLTDADHPEEVEEFASKDQYYYRTNLICAFEEDEEYGLAPTFDDNGRTNQWFSANYERITDEKHNHLVLLLNEDGTFVLRDQVFDITQGIVDQGVAYEGTYTLDGDVLNLDCGDKTMPFLFLNDKIYFDVLEKQQ